MPKKKSSLSQKKLSLETSGFYSDFSKPDTLYAALIRSPASSGKIKSIVLPNIPEGYYLFNANDFPGEKNLTVNKTSHKIFGYDNVGYSGEPIGILLGPDENKVYELLANVSVNFDIESLESALKNVMRHQKRTVVPLSKLSDKDTSSDFSSFLSEINDLPSLDAVLDKNHIEENTEEIVATREIKSGLYKEMSVEKADAELFVENENQIVSTDTWEQKLSDPSWQETNGAFVYYENSKLHIYAPTRWTSFTLKTVSESLKISPENIIIHKTKSIGVFSRGLWRTTQIITQVALAAYLTKKPVKLIFTQQEQDVYMIPGVKTKITYKTVMEKTGRIKGLKADIDIDVGAYNPFAQEIVDRISLAACNYYQFDNVCIQAQASTSKTPPSSICMKSIDSQAFFSIENQIQRLKTKRN